MLDASSRSRFQGRRPSQSLKKAIKNEAFPDVAASAETLHLYKPTGRNPVAEPYEGNLSNVVLSELGKPLQSLRKLSDLFIAALPEEYVHPGSYHRGCVLSGCDPSAPLSSITVSPDIPYPTIFYWFRGADISQEGSFKIQSNKTISALKEQLAKRHVELGDATHRLHEEDSISSRRMRASPSTVPERLQDSLDDSRRGRFRGEVRKCHV